MNMYTTKEQVMKLTNIVDIDTADMSYVRGEANLTPYKDMKNFWAGTNCEVLPCWSAGRIMQLMPSDIEIDGVEYHPTWKKTVAWILSYEHDGDILMFKIGDLIDISIAMLTDLKEEEES